MDSIKKLAASLKFVRESIADAISHDEDQEYGYVGLCQAGLSEEISGNVEAAEVSYLAALASAHRNGIDSLGVLLPTNLLADLYQSHDRFSEAEGLYRRAIEIFVKHRLLHSATQQAIIDEFGPAKNAKYQAMYKQFKTVMKIFHPSQDNLQIRVLESYAALLRKTDRRGEAEVLEFSAEALRMEQENS
jgi:hypothetical protein